MEAEAVGVSTKDFDTSKIKYYFDAGKYDWLVVKVKEMGVEFYHALCAAWVESYGCMNK